MSIKSAVTISLVKEAEGGPFIFWHDLAAGCEKAAELGYDAVEVFAPNAAAIPVDRLRQLEITVEEHEHIDRSYHGRRLGPLVTGHTGRGCRQKLTSGDGTRWLRRFTGIWT